MTDVKNLWPRFSPEINLGHLLQRGPGSDEQWLHRDEAVWSDLPRPHPEVQLASVIAFVGPGGPRASCLEERATYFARLKDALHDVLVGMRRQ